ncbi:MAG: efflux RND transporter periplasmic adaptor subunit [Planctomycetes bacterium]|nr:efflux RND transporter periplasmic adaptor subunit [Planctomycetota bacterium]
MTTRSPHSSPRGPNRRVVLVAGIAVLVIALGIWVFGGSVAHSSRVDETFTVARGNLRISFVETGAIRSEKPISIMAQLEGQNTILKLLPEGTYVKEGDVIAELDASNIVERRQQEQMAMAKARAAYVQAKEAYDIQRNINDSLIKAAELDAEFADKDLEKYRDGDWPQQQRDAQGDIAIADEELKRAIDRSQWSEKLAANGYISDSELEADRLAVKKRTLDLELAKGKARVLEAYTNPKELKRLQASAEEKKADLERVKQRAAAMLAQTDADLKAKEEANELEKIRLDKWEDQFKKATIHAPASGMVVYATTNPSSRSSSRTESPIQEGANVRENEVIVTLPDLSKMIADVKVHESALDRVKKGQPAIVTVDALPSEPFHGKVNRVALLPDAQSSWLNPDLKVYTTEIRLAGDTSMLRPGMSCSVEIVADDLTDVLYVPVQSVQPRDNEHVAFVVGAGGVPEPRAVEVGEHNEEFVVITKGLAEGDRVLLAPPPPPEESKTVPRPGGSSVQPIPRDGVEPDVDSAEPDDGAGRDAGAKPKKKHSKTPKKSSHKSTAPKPAQTQEDPNQNGNSQTGSNDGNH